MGRLCSSLLIATSLSLAAVLPASAASLVPEATPEGAPAALTPVQYSGDLCANWQRECARLWGWRTRRWHECMGQPAAVWDCGGGQTYGYGGRRRGSCGNWRRECARLYGWRSQRWYECMNQPGAVQDCQ